MTDHITHVDGIRIRWSPRGFTGFANGLAEGDVITIEFWGDYYKVRVTSCRTVPNCVTPYVELELV